MVCPNFDAVPGFYSTFRGYFDDCFGGFFDIEIGEEMAAALDGHALKSRVVLEWRLFRCVFRHNLVCTSNHYQGWNFDA